MALLAFSPMQKSSVGLCSSSIRSSSRSIGNSSSSSSSRLRASKFYPDYADGDYRVKKVSAKQLDRILFKKERERPMVVDFYATWCGPCIMVARILEQLAVEYENHVNFLKVDTDEEYELIREMGIRGLPSMLFVSKDVEKQALLTEGIIPLSVCRTMIEKEIMDEPMPPFPLAVLGWKLPEITY